MANPVVPADRAPHAATERVAAPPYGLLAVLLGQDVVAVRERPEYLAAANEQMRAFVGRYFGQGASPTENDLRARVAAELSRHVSAMAGAPNLGALRGALVDRLGARQDARLLELLAEAERRWPVRQPIGPQRSLIAPEPPNGVRLDPPRPPALIPPRAGEAEQARAEEMHRAAQIEARRQRDLADIIALWRTLPADTTVHEVQKDEYRSHALGELARLYGSRAEGLQAVADIDAVLADEMARWVRPPLPSVRR